MEPEPDNKLSDLKERLASGEYAVDPQAVADAILRRSRDAAVVRAELAQVRRLDLAAEPDGVLGSEQADGGQTECSNPAKGRLASGKQTPGSPWTTRPIQAIRTAGSTCLTAASTTLRALGGTQAHSS